MAVRAQVCAHRIAHAHRPALARDRQAADRAGRAPPRTPAMQRLAHGQRVERGATRRGTEVRRERVAELEHDRRRPERLAALRLGRDVRHVQRLARAEQRPRRIAWRSRSRGDTSPGARLAAQIERARLVLRREPALGEPDDARDPERHRAMRRAAARSSRRPRAARRDPSARRRAGAPRARAPRETRRAGRRDRRARCRRASTARARYRASCRRSRARDDRCTRRRARRTAPPTRRAWPRASRATPHRRTASARAARRSPRSRADPAAPPRARPRCRRSRAGPRSAPTMYAPSASRRTP